MEYTYFLTFGFRTDENIGETSTIIKRDKKILTIDDLNKIEEGVKLSGEYFLVKTLNITLLDTKEEPCVNCTAYKNADFKLVVEHGTNKIFKYCPDCGRRLEEGNNED